MKQQAPGRKRFSVGEAYLTIYRMFRSLPGFRRARHHKLMTQHFSERLMLAVTEVNQCAMCSYAHTKMALEYGMSQDEIDAMLSGDHSAVAQEELPGILFAQHYADSRAKPSREAWQTVVKDYGEAKSIGILGAIRMMTVGNIYGIALGSFIARLTRNTKAVDKRNSLGYELAILLTLPVFLPVAAVHALLASLAGAPVIRFSQVSG